LWKKNLQEPSSPGKKNRKDKKSKILNQDLDRPVTSEEGEHPSTRGGRQVRGLMASGLGRRKGRQGGRDFLRVPRGEPVRKKGVGKFIKFGSWYGKKRGLSFKKFHGRQTPKDGGPSPQRVTSGRKGTSG